MKYQPINPQLFVQNRSRFTKEMKPNSLAIFNSNDDMPRNGDQDFPFRQNSDFFYLTGIDQAKSVLFIFPDCPLEKYREALFLEETNEHIAIWYGKKYSKEEAIAVSGIKNVFWLDTLDGAIKEVMAACEYVYLNANENPKYSNPVPYRDIRFNEDLTKKFPAHKYERANPIVCKLRMVKSDIEIDLTKEAISITDKAFRRILSFTKPGVMEYEVEAEITHEFIRNRANGHAYYPIVASGKGACVLHYIENNKECKYGDLMLLDFGAEYANYAADLSRTIPVNGKFTPRQKEVYNACLRVMKAAIKHLVPGTTIDKYHAEVCKIMEKELIGLGLFTAEDVKKQDLAKPMYFKYYMHGTSHFIGLDVHDVGTRQDIIKPGMLFSCEPGIYIQEEGIGIRIENDILTTENGNIDLMAGIPIEVEEIEKLMKK
ncbi:MAG: aminopeptidase P N-terminal domain-containing protein [Bacteroidales bacterium]|jgi:Xaa-Pro aminopeptidase